MATPRLTSSRPPRDQEWRCHRCSARHTLKAIRVERCHETGQRIRIRRCSNCQAACATEERFIPLEQFYGRAGPTATERDRRLRARTARRASNTMPCKFCPGAYRRGTFSRHVRTPEHMAVLARQYSENERNSKRRSANRKYWAKRGVSPNEAVQRALADLNPDRITDGERAA